MSMTAYLASSVPLPLGEFIAPPDAVYADYAAYQASKDYFVPGTYERLMPASYDFSNKLYRTDCPVHVYRSYTAAHYIGIWDYAEISPTSRILSDVQAQAMADQDVTGQFTLPYIYILGCTCNDTMLMHCLCAHLKRGDKAELYECWSFTETEERDKTWDLTVNLQDFVDGEGFVLPETEYAKQAEKRFITFIAPQTGSDVFRSYISRQEAIRIYADRRWEKIPYSLAERTLKDPQK